MNLDFLIDHVMQHVKPLDWECVLSSPVQLKVVASCLDSLRPVLLSDFRCQKGEVLPDPQNATQHNTLKTKLAKTS